MSQFCRSLLAVKRQGDFHDGGREPHASLDESLVLSPDLLFCFFTQLFIVTNEKGRTEWRPGYKEG